MKRGSVTFGMTRLATHVTPDLPHLHPWTPHVGQTNKRQAVWVPSLTREVLSYSPGLPLLFKDKDPISGSQMGPRCSRNVSRECYVCTYLCKTPASCHLFWWLLQGNGQPNPSGSFMWIHWTDPLSLNNNPINCWETRAWLFRVVFLTERAGACLSHGALTE